MKTFPHLKKKVISANGTHSRGSLECILQFAFGDYILKPHFNSSLKVVYLGIGISGKF